MAREEARARVIEDSETLVNMSVNSDGSINTSIVRRLGTWTTSSLTNMNVNGSVTPQVFTVTPSTGKKYVITRLVFTIEDSGIKYDRFGGLPTLTNGVNLLVKEGGLSERTFGPFQSNQLLYQAGFDVEITSSTVDLLVAKLNLIESATAFELKDSLSEYIKVEINDDLTGLDNFTLSINGYEVDE